ncbi:MAG: hypothetical protein HZB68_02590 [Candidatus Aenigmarchaeota archaeon]|nr:hypothetical protein [Candidatus Aenigmarchaeota archaeon]
MVVVERGYSKERAKELKEKHIYDLKANGYSVKNEVIPVCHFNHIAPGLKLRIRENGGFLKRGRKLAEFDFFNKHASIDIYSKKLLPEMEAFAKEWEESFGENTAKIIRRY